jgi:hypothetical protein
MSLDPWVSSAALRFQRGISLVLLTLAALIVGIELVRYGRGEEGWALAGVLALISLSVLGLARRLQNPTADPRSIDTGYEQKLRSRSLNT